MMTTNTFKTSPTYTPLTHTISIASGKGGVGKTTMSTNLAVTLAKKGNRVLILDADFGMANVDIFFQKKPQGHILEVLKGDRALTDIITPVNKNLSFISGGTGLREINNLNNFERRALMDSVIELPYKYDYLIIDSAPGLAENVLYFNAACETNLIMLTADPSSFADAYALIKVLNQGYKKRKFSVVCNQVRNEEEGYGLYYRFNEVVEKFLDINLDYLGSLSFSTSIKSLQQNQKLVTLNEPESLASVEFQKIAEQIFTQRSQNETRYGWNEFWNQVVGVA